MGGSGVGSCPAWKGQGFGGTSQQPPVPSGGVSEQGPGHSSGVKSKLSFPFGNMLKYDHSVFIIF